jgi:ankyrin repeat protein
MNESVCFSLHVCYSSVGFLSHLHIIPLSESRLILLLGSALDKMANNDFFDAARRGNLPLVQMMLADGDESITERDYQGRTAHLLAARYGRFMMCQWLLEHGGADIADVAAGQTVWTALKLCFARSDGLAEVTSLLRVMVLKGAPSGTLVALLRPVHVQVVEAGARLRAALPAYLAQRQALLNAHCPLITPLLALVQEYDPEPTTTGLGEAP